MIQVAYRLAIVLFVRVAVPITLWMFGQVHVEVQDLPIDPEDLGRGYGAILHLQIGPPVIRSLVSCIWYCSIYEPFDLLLYSLV